MTPKLIKKLDTFLCETQNKQMVWGVDDCTMQAHKWVEYATGVNIPSIKYSSQEEAYRLIAQKGGLDQIWYEAMRDHFSLSYSDIPEYGDVGIIELSTNLVGCIFAGGGVSVLRTETGWRFLSARPKYIKQVWSLGLCKKYS